LSSSCRGYPLKLVSASRCQVVVVDGFSWLFGCIGFLVVNSKAEAMNFLLFTDPDSYRD